ncbi:hypothetical protein PL11201_670002 [Planktothrix sp. PCC 11201]|nr:hypothetical protein PL11201_670002 [Planktothrix sp. PCC 11201]
MRFSDYFYSLKPSFLAKTKAVYLAILFGLSSPSSMAPNSPILLPYSGNSGIDSQGTTSPTSLIPWGWDAGLKIRRVAGYYPGSPVYFESCPDGVGGKCYGSIPNRSGFYTLAYGSFSYKDKVGPTGKLSCIPNEAENPNAPNDRILMEPHPSEPVGTPPVKGRCPYFFYWRNNGGSPSAYLINDSSSLPQIPFGYGSFYIGLQENLKTYAGTYGGLDHRNRVMTPLYAWVQGVRLKLRAKVCFADKTQDLYRKIRVHTDMTFYSLKSRRGFGVSVNLMDYVINQGKISTLPELFHEPKVAEYSLAQLHVNGKLWNVTPQDLKFTVDQSSNCNLPLKDLPFQDVYIPFKAIFERLIAEGKIDRRLTEDAILSSTIVVGLEQWGRNRSEVEISDRSILISLPPIAW